MMWMPVLKVLAGLAAAVVLIWIASRKLRSRKRDDRTLRSLPGRVGSNRVQMRYRTIAKGCLKRVRDSEYIKNQSKTRKFIVF